MSRFLRPGWLVLYVLVLWFLFSSVSSRSVTPPESMTIAEGENLTQAGLFDDLGIWKEFRLKRYLRKHEEQLKTIQPGTYQFSGSYSYDELLQVFIEGPAQRYNHITILEGWSSFDIDAYLASEGTIQAGEYRAFVQNQDIINRYIQRYAFLSQAAQEKGSLSSLEGYLYPSTYYVDPTLNVIDQLVYLQLEEYNKRIRIPYGEQLIALSDSLAADGYQFTLSTYGALILASIVEKEERVVANRAKITSVFYNRLNDGMRIDADISLCYGLELTHTNCTPSVIGQNIFDDTNSYNTRAVGGLPPTPISSVTASAMKSLLDAEPSDYYYYLHDSNAQIHLARDLSEHNVNKSKYIR